MAYDIESNTWIHLEPTGTAPEAMNTNGAFYDYDPRLDIVVIDSNAGKNSRHLHLRSKTNSCADPLSFPADGPKFNFAANTCYDRELNAYFCHRRRRQLRQRRRVGLSVQETRLTLQSAGRSARGVACQPLGNGSRDSFTRGMT